MEVMESDLTCCVCLEIFVYPLMLPCTHNLCRRCVQGLTSDTSIAKFNCPKCRSEIQIDSRKGIYSLPRNLALDNLACLFRNKAQITAAKNCNAHNKSLDFYCQTCKCLVCEDCSTSKHNDFPHNVASMKHLIAGEKNNVQDLMDQMDDIEAELNRNKGTVQRFIKDIKANEEASCQKVEQNLAQLIAAINTMKEVFVKKLRQDSQQQIEHLASLDQDYRRLQLDICALRSQIRYQDSPDLVHQYMAYQNIKMRVSSFLAFKLFKVACPPESKPVETTWKLENSQHVYHAIQALEIRKECADQRIVCASQSLPGSPRHQLQSCTHTQNSLEYSSDNEGFGKVEDDTTEKRHLKIKNLAPTVDTLIASRHVTQRDADGNVTNSGLIGPGGPIFTSPVSAPVLSGSEPFKFFKNSKTDLQNKFKYGQLEPEQNFKTFVGEFSIKPGNFVTSKNKEGKDVNLKAGLGELSSSEPSIAVGAQPSTSVFSESETPSMSAFGGARPKEPRNSISNGHASRLSQAEALRPTFSLPPEMDNSGLFKQENSESADFHRCSSLDSATSRSNTTNNGVVADQTLLFTVGSSAKTRKGRSKGQKKRDHSGGRSQPNKHHK